ncbi:MAG: pitrilysin family protein [Bacteroidales bacterium]
MLDRSVAPMVKDFTDVDIIKPTQWSLENGIKVKEFNCASEEVVRIDFIFRGGMLQQGQPMLLPMLLSMLSQGTRNYSSADIAECFDYCGAWIDTNMYDNYSVVTVYCINRCLDKVLPVIEEMIKYPTFPSEEFKVVKSQTLSLLRTNHERVSYLAMRGFNRAFFGDSHPLGKEGTISGLRKINVEELSGLHKAIFTSDGALIQIAGCVTDDVRELITNYFSNSWGGSAVDISTVDKTPSRKRLNICNKSNAVQSAVIMGMETINRDNPDYLTMRVLITALGGYFGSRLMSNIREDKGYTYGIHGHLLGKSDMAYMIISSECDTSYTYPLIQECIKEIERLKVELIADEELKLVKSYMLSNLAKISDSPFSISDYYLTAYCNNIPKEYFNNQVAVIKNITPEELLEVAKKYLNIEQLYIIIAGDKMKLPQNEQGISKS